MVKQFKAAGGQLAEGQDELIASLRRQQEELINGTYWDHYGDHIKPPNIIDQGHHQFSDDFLHGIGHLDKSIVHTEGVLAKLDPSYKIDSHFDIDDVLQHFQNLFHNIGDWLSDIFT
jgi:hypothetical protein